MFVNFFLKDITKDSYNFLFDKSDYFEVKFFDEFTGRKFLNNINCKILKTEEIDDKIIVYGYTPNFSNYKIVGNKKINIQFVIGGDFCKIGYPMIYTSF